MCDFLSEAQLNSINNRCVFQSTFRCENVLVSFLTNSSMQYEWLKYYLEPYYKIDDSINSNCRVYSVESSKLFNQVLTQLESHKHIHTKMYLNRNCKKYTIQRTTVVVEEDCRTISISSRLSNHIVLLINPSNKAGCLDAVRVVREVINKSLESYGFYLFHFGCIAYNNKGVLFGGDKGAGKTTMILGALSLMKNKVSFVSNDRVYLTSSNGKHRAYGFPTTTTIGAGTLKHCKPLHQFVRNPDLLRYPKKALELSRDELEKPDSDLSKIKSKLSVTQSELKHIFGCDLLSDTQVHVLVFPQIERNRDVKLELMSRKDLEKALQKQCFTPHDLNWPDWLSWRRESNYQLATSSKQLCERIAADFLGYRLEFSNGRIAFENIVELLEL